MSFIHIDGGARTDTSRLDGTLPDLTAISNGRLTSIEHLDFRLGDEVGRTLVLDISDLLALTNSKTLVVTGNDGDRLELHDHPDIGGIWAAHGTRSDLGDGLTYNVIEINNSSVIATIFAQSAVDAID